MMTRAKKFLAASRVYSELTATEREDILRRYKAREPIASIAKEIHRSVRVVRTFIALEIQAKRIKEQLDQRQLDRLESNFIEEKKVYDADTPRAGDRYLLDKRAAAAGSRKLLEAIHRYLEKRDAAQRENKDANI